MISEAGLPALLVFGIGSATIAIALVAYAMHRRHKKYGNMLLIDRSIHFVIEDW